MSDLEQDDVPLLAKQAPRLSDEKYTEILQLAYNAGNAALDHAVATLPPSPTSATE